MKVSGRGLGLRREFAAQLSAEPKRTDIDFLEVVPDNWMDIGGSSIDLLDSLAEKYPLVAHGLNLSIGDAQCLDQDYVFSVRKFLDRYGISIYSDHMSMSRDRQGYLYELLPIPRSRAGVVFIADKIQAAQEMLSRRLVLENISYYYEEPQQMPESEFLAELVQRSGCGLLLDINNLYVNQRNHGIDPIEFMNQLPGNSVIYYHVAGHLEEAGAELLLDTHGSAVAPEVMRLGAHAISRFGEVPIVLERDNNLPSLDALCAELNLVHRTMLSERGILR